MFYSGGFQLGTDYNFECQENGILVTSEDSSFVLTDRAKNIETECKGMVNFEACHLQFPIFLLSILVGIL